MYDISGLDANLMAVGDAGHQQYSNVVGLEKEKISSKTTFNPVFKL